MSGLRHYYDCRIARSIAPEVVIGQYVNGYRIVLIRSWRIVIGVGHIRYIQWTGQGICLGFVAQVHKGI